MKLFLLNHLDDETKVKIDQNNARYWRREINEDEHEQTYETIMQHWRMETERILNLPYEINRTFTPRRI